MDAQHVGMSARCFSLMLVKGDEGVEAGEEGAYGTLLSSRWQANRSVKNIFVVKPFDGAPFKARPCLIVVINLEKGVQQPFIVFEPYNI